jgi:NADPH:quinone reductase-like Zn-dependent oxidoreductase
MKAIILKAAGGTNQLSITEVPVPSPKAGEVLIQVHAISINPVDVKTRKGGSLYKMLQEQPPVILGWDVSGVVTAVGSGVDRFKVGDAVFGMVNFPGHGRAYAEYVAAPQEHLAHKPGTISHGEATAATLAALTAWQVLVHEAKLTKGQTILIHAAAGGVGHYAVQIARYLGATVSGTASAANAGFLKELGVQYPLDYTLPDMFEKVKDIDTVLDPIGGETTARSIQVLKPGGTLISIVGGVKENLSSAIQKKNLNAKNYLVHSSGADMEQLAGLLKEGVLKSYVSQQFEFEKIADAHHQIETGKTRGKIILNVR